MTATAPGRRFRWLPAGASEDAATLLTTRGLRAIGDGFVSVLLPVHLAALGFSAVRIGVVVTATLLGSAVLTLLVGFVAHRYPRRRLLIQASALMTLTGLAFAFLGDFWPLLIVSFVGTLNPSGGDVSVFVPTEQTLLPQTVPGRARTAIYARYNLVGQLLAAAGALAAGLPDLLGQRGIVTADDATRGMFLLYALLGLLVSWRYRALSPAVEPPPSPQRAALGPSRGIVLRLAALFSLDSFAGGFVVQSLLALWLFERYGLSAATAGVIFFVSGLLSAVSQLAAPVIAARIGLVKTMAFTHLPANLFLLLTPFMPSVGLAVACMFGRALFSSMDVPARQSYTMAVVTPPERPAAASLTNVPRSLAAALSPSLSGWMLATSPFGWPLVIAGALKAAYDLLLLQQFHAIKPPEEES